MVSICSSLDMRKMGHIRPPVHCPWVGVEREDCIPRHRRATSSRSMRSMLAISPPTVSLLVVTRPSGSCPPGMTNATQDPGNYYVVDMLSKSNHGPAAQIL